MPQAEMKAKTWAAEEGGRPDLCASLPFSAWPGTQRETARLLFWRRRFDDRQSAPGVCVYDCWMYIGGSQPRNVNHGSGLFCGRSEVGGSETVQRAGCAVSARTGPVTSVLVRTQEGVSVAKHPIVHRDERLLDRGVGLHGTKRLVSDGWVSPLQEAVL